MFQEEKLEAYRNHEFELEEKLCAASGLIRDLQEENETLVKREADYVHQVSKKADYVTLKQTKIKTSFSRSQP